MRETGLVLASGSLVYVVGSLVYLRVAPVVTSVGAVAVLVAAVGLGMAPAVVGAGAPWLVATVVLTALPRSGLASAGYALAARGAEGALDRATAIGFLNSVFAAASVAAPVLAGALSGVGVRWVYLGAAVVAVLAAVALRRLARAGSSAPVAGRRVPAARVPRPAAAGGHRGPRERARTGRELDGP